MRIGSLRGRRRKGERRRPLVERLFRAYFLEGALIGDHVVLAELAGEAGFDAGRRAHAGSPRDEGIDAVAAADRRSRELGIGGVPFFIFNRRIAVSGAQEPRRRSSRR